MRASILLALGLAACNVCGTYSYKGYEVEEHCGSIYGTQGIYYLGNEVAELSIQSSTPIDRPGLEWGWYGEPTVSILFWAEDLRQGTELGLEDVVASCTWNEAPGPWDSEPTLHQGEPTAMELRVGRSVLDPALGGEGPLRKFTWFVECEDGELWAEGSDTVRLRERTGSSSVTPGD